MIIIMWIALCVVVLTIAGCLAIRDRAIRETFVADGEIRREQITPAMPNSWMRDFFERGP